MWVGICSIFTKPITVKLINPIIMLVKLRYFLKFFIDKVKGNILLCSGCEADAIKGLGLVILADLAFIYDIWIKGWVFIVYVYCFEGIFKAPFPSSNTKPIVIIIINPMYY